MMILVLFVLIGWLNVIVFLLIFIFFWLNLVIFLFMRMMDVNVLFILNKLMLLMDKLVFFKSWLMVFFGVFVSLDVFSLIDVKLSIAVSGLICCFVVFFFDISINVLVLLFILGVFLVVIVLLVVKIGLSFVSWLRFVFGCSFLFAVIVCCLFFLLV